MLGDGDLSGSLGLLLQIFLCWLPYGVLWWILCLHHTHGEELANMSACGCRQVPGCTWMKQSNKYGTECWVSSASAVIQFSFGLWKVGRDVVTWFLLSSLSLQQHELSLTTFYPRVTGYISAHLYQPLVPCLSKRVVCDHNLVSQLLDR